MYIHIYIYVPRHVGLPALLSPSPYILRGFWPGGILNIGLCYTHVETDARWMFIGCSLDVRWMFAVIGGPSDELIGTGIKKKEECDLRKACPSLPLAPKPHHGQWRCWSFGLPGTATGRRVTMVPMWREGERERERERDTPMYFLYVTMQTMQD